MIARGKIKYQNGMISDFEWDEQKNRENQDKHAVSFEDAQRAFQDPSRLNRQDELAKSLNMKTIPLLSAKPPRARW